MKLSWYHLRISALGLIFHPLPRSPPTLTGVEIVCARPSYLVASVKVTSQPGPLPCRLLWSGERISGVQLRRHLAMAAGRYLVTASGRKLTMVKAQPERVQEKADEQRVYLRVFLFSFCLFQEVD